MTPRQTQVAQLVVTGATNKQIGVVLSIAPSTVGCYMKELMQIYNVHTRAALAVLIDRQAQKN